MWFFMIISLVPPDEELSALQAMEEVTMRFNIEDSDLDDDSPRYHDDSHDRDSPEMEPAGARVAMAMVETGSLHSEEGDTRPAPMFVAPPPPSEPPPEDTTPISLSMITHNTVDIGGLLEVLTTLKNCLSISIFFI